MEVAAFSTELQPIQRAAGAPGQLRIVEPRASGTQTRRPVERADDSATISREARDAAGVSAGDARQPRGVDGEPLTDEQAREVEELQARDAEVRAHEQAHVAAAGTLFRGGPTYTYQTGPDGKRYAVGGMVQIDTSEGATPEETIQKAAQIRRAALAPAEPSSTDQAVAANASRMEAEARAELAREDEQAPTAAASSPEISVGARYGIDRYMAVENTADADRPRVDFTA
ncbi:MAG: putative metalloprotease CJM1_0395 family protein [Planctomycetota bacterium]